MSARGVSTDERHRTVSNGATQTAELTHLALGARGGRVARRKRGRRLVLGHLRVVRVRGAAPSTKELCVGALPASRGGQAEVLTSNLVETTVLSLSGEASCGG